MKINRKEYEEAYQLGRKVYSKSIRLTDAADSLERIGVNRGSAVHLVSNLGKMLNGQGFITSLSAPVFDDYLTWILRDYGQSTLGKAISAIERHLNDYESRRKTTLHDLAKVLEKHRKLVSRESTDFISPEEISSTKKILEGRLKIVRVNFYERSAKARSTCIEKHGTICAVCEFNFGKIYGDIGKGFIHVHHLRDLASIGKEYEINPIEDLRPVCPNCHAMLHKSNPPYTIKQMKEMIHLQKT